MKVLFVCTGNSCRSVMAEYLMRRTAEQSGRKGVIASSAGTHAWEGGGSTVETLTVLREEGLDAAGHRARRVDRAMVDEADLVVAMTSVHRDWLLRQLKVPERKVRMLLKEDVADPIGLSVDTYRACRDTIKKGVEALLKEVGKS